MKIKVDQEKCIGCGSCVGISPDVFEFNDDGLANCVENEIPEELVEEAADAQNSCPVGAIEDIE